MKKMPVVIAAIICSILGFVMGRITEHSNDLKQSIPEETNIGAAVNMVPLEMQQSEDKTDGAIQAYREFLTGTRKASTYDIDSIIIPTGEPDSRYFTEYAFFDSNGDKIPELHVRSAREYLIFIYKDNEIVYWSSLSPYTKPLDNKAFLTTRYLYAATTESHEYTILDYYGNKVFQIGFSVYDANQNNTYDESDEYWFCGAEVSKETYDILTKPYLTISSDSVTWVVLCETVN